jgi:PmbA protein
MRASRRGPAGEGPFADLDLEDAAERSPQDLRAAAEEAEDAARAVAGVTNSEGAGASAGRGVVALATSHGFSGAYAATSHGLSASVVAGEGGAMQRDYSWRSGRHAADLLPPAEIGRAPGPRRGAAQPRQAQERNDAGGVRSARRGSLVGHLLGAISGAAIARRASFLLDRDGAQLFDSAITILDDPLRPRGLRSRPFDGEGLPTAPRAGGGRAADRMADGFGLGPPAGRGADRPCLARGFGAAARHGQQRGAPARHGHAAGADGGHRRRRLCDRADRQGVNGVTGDYSRGASGFRIVNGEIAGPVAEFTVAGNLIDMFAALVAADDLDIHRGIDVPTLRIDRLSIAGD